MSIRNKKGMAIVISLTLSTALLIMGMSYISTLQKTGGHNSIELGSVQADLLADGVSQIAMLKFKEVPGPFYYAYIANVKKIDNVPYKTYNSDSVLNPDLKSPASPFNAKCSTTFAMLSSKMYQDMNIKISVVVNVTRADGKIYSRKIERTVSGARKIAY